MTGRRPGRAPRPPMSDANHTDHPDPTSYDQEKEPMTTTRISALSPKQFTNDSIYARFTGGDGEKAVDNGSLPDIHWPSLGQFTPESAVTCGRLLSSCRADVFRFWSGHDRQVGPRAELQLRCSGASPTERTRPTREHGRRTDWRTATPALPNVRPSRSHRRGALQGRGGSRALPLPHWSHLAHEVGDRPGQADAVVRNARAPHQGHRSRKSSRKISRAIGTPAQARTASRRDLRGLWGSCGSRMVMSGSYGTSRCRGELVRPARRFPTTCRAVLGHAMENRDLVLEVVGRHEGAVDAGEQQAGDLVKVAQGPLVGGVTS